MKIIKRTAKSKRALRVRAKLTGTADRPRLSVFRSNKNLLAQLIDDEKQLTILGLSSIKLKQSGNKTEQATALGKAIAEAAKAKGVETVIFDRGAYRFHGRVKAVAEAARAGGLNF